MTLNQIKYFCTAAQYHSITKASEILYITQPTISAAIKELEAEFMITLFSRKGNRFTLTSEGEKFYEKALFLLRYSDEMKEELSGNNAAKPIIRLGIPPMLSTLYFPKLLNDFKKDYPDIWLELSEYGSIRASELVAGDHLDTAIVNMEIYNIDKFNSIIMEKDQLYFCVSHNHPLADSEAVSLEDLRREPLILFNSDSVQNNLLMTRFESLNIKPLIVMRSSQIYTTLQFVKEGSCGCFLFKSMLPVFPELKGIPLNPAIPVNIGLIWKKGRYMSNALNSLIDFINK